MSQVVENVANATTPEQELKRLAEQRAAEIAAQAAERTSELVAANPALSLKQVVFHFKKEKIRNEKGEVIGEGEKRDSITMNLPVPSLISLINHENPKVRELVEESVLDTIYTRARELFSEDSKKELNAGNFPYEKLDWEAIAMLPPAEKRGGGIAKETWDAFYEDYVAVMVAATGKDQERCTKAADLFKARLQPVRSRKDVLAALKELLATWYINTKQQEEFVDVFKFLDSKADVFLKEDDSALLEAL